MLRHIFNLRGRRTNNENYTQTALLTQQQQQQQVEEEEDEKLTHVANCWWCSKNECKIRTNVQTSDARTSERDYEYEYK